MKKLLLTYFFIVSCLLNFTCVNEPPLLPGLTMSSVVVVTEPDSVAINFNGKETGNITPFKISGLEPGFQKLVLKRYAYLDTTYYCLTKRNVTDSIFVEMREDIIYWWKTYDKDNSGIPDGILNELAVDKDDNIWAAIPGYGIIMYNGQNWAIYDSLNSGLSSNFVSKILPAQNGTIWIGTENGLVKFDGVKWSPYNIENSNLNDNKISALAIDKNNVLWFGSFSGGLTKFDGVKFTNYNYHNSGLPLNHVSDIFVDDNNIVWVATWGNGFARFDGTEWQTYNSFKGGLSDNRISVLLKDRNDILWIGCGQSFFGENGGLSSFDGNKIINYTQASSPLPASTVTDLKLDIYNRLWITTPKGLVSLNTETYRWTIFTTENTGLQTNSVTCITIDSEQNKWMGSRGIYVYSGSKKK